MLGFLGNYLAIFSVISLKLHCYHINLLVYDLIILYLFFRWGFRTGYKRKIGFGATKSVSTLCKFKNISDEKLQSSQQNQLKRCTFAKMQWAVKAYRDWRNVKLADPISYDYRIYRSDLDRPDLMSKESFEFSMCKFIVEVTKVKDGSDYPGKCVSIQKFLSQKGLAWRLVEGNAFVTLRTTLDNVMKERAANNIGTIK